MSDPSGGPRVAGDDRARPEDSIVLPFPVIDDGKPQESQTASMVLLGQRLRDLRGNRTLQAVVKQARFSAAKLCRLEKGQSPPKMRDIQLLMKIYGATGPQRAAVEELAQCAAAPRPHWLGMHREVLTPWSKPLYTAEAAADLLLNYEAVVMPGLLHEREYAQAVLEATLPSAMLYQVGQRVRLRMDRQERFFATPPRSVFFMKEGVLYEPFGSPRVMVNQLQRMVQITETTNLGVRIITRRTAFASHITSLTKLTFEGRNKTELIYNEVGGGAEYHTADPAGLPAERSAGHVSQLDVLREKLDQLMVLGASREESRCLLLQAVEHFRAQL